MAVYILVDFFIVALGFVLGGRRCFSLSNNSCNKINSGLFFFIVGMLLLFISAFRGNFAVDYDNYVDLFYRYDGWSLQRLLEKKWFSYPENGYLVFQYMLKKLWDDSLIIFIATSVIIVFSNLSEIRKHFVFGVLPVILFLDLGNYYTSFNTMRQVLAASIIVFGSRYLYNRNFFHYIIVVFIAFSIHTSSLVMIPVFFLSDIKMGKRGTVFFVLITIILSYLLPSIILLVQKYYWGWYGDDGYGMKGYSFNNIVRPLFLFAVPIILELFPMYGSKALSGRETITEKELNIWRNSSYLYFLFSVLGMRIEMVERFSSFFSTYAIMFFSYTVLKNTGRYRQLVIISIIVISVVFGYVTKCNTAYNPFTFIF